MLVRQTQDLTLPHRKDKGSVQKQCKQAYLHLCQAKILRRTAENVLHFTAENQNCI